MISAVEDKSTMRKATTKDKILAHGAQIIHRKGFKNTGIQELLYSAGVPRGSFYFYFKSKEDFGLELIDYYFNFFASMIESHLKGPDASPLKRLQRFFEGFRSLCEQHGCRGGCPIGNLTQEMGALNDIFQQKLRHSLNKMKVGIAECLDLARQEKEIDPALDVSETADFILNSWEGALLRMKAEGNTAPLVLFEKMTFGRVLEKKFSKRSKSTEMDRR
jgi:TetR/AcrR family transcriptional regulator, transcriptional repressor for nem operon